jgi:hypothetical protein
MIFNIIMAPNYQNKDTKQEINRKSLWGRQDVWHPAAAVTAPVTEP